MSTRPSTVKPPVVTASMIRSALGDALSRIRVEERMTWVELGDELGKSDDQAAKYCDATAEMSVTTFYRAKQRWNGRFTGAADKLVAQTVPEQDAQTAQTCILRAALALSTALEDGSLTDAEIHANRSTLEVSRDAIDSLLARLAPKDLRA